MLVVSVAFVAALIFRFSADLSNPGRLESRAELYAVLRITSAAIQGMEKSDPRRRIVTAVWARLEGSYAGLVVSFIYLPFSDALTAEELAVLAPFIDKDIAGAEPLADERAADIVALNGLKERMKAKRLWPTSPAAEY